MITRLVKLQFQADKVGLFLSLFEERKAIIRHFDGCQHLELWQDEKQANIFFTYSHWQSEAHLEAYRHSDFFKGIWKNTKQLFCAKPEAWTVQVRHNVS